MTPGFTRKPLVSTGDETLAALERTCGRAQSEAEVEGVVAQKRLRPRL
jgi:hypothetical protein